MNFLCFFFLPHHVTKQQLNMSGNNYNFPVSVPVGGGTYGEASMLQTSPQLAHQSISPRPSSSETDSGIFRSFLLVFFVKVCLYLRIKIPKNKHFSVVTAEHFSVYPSGAMLEMSNGYPHSSSPIGGSPSPGPSPSGISSNHLNPKCKYFCKYFEIKMEETTKNLRIFNLAALQKQHSPGSQSGRNLRVVIPTQMATGLSSDDNPYSEVNVLFVRSFIVSSERQFL